MEPESQSLPGGDFPVDGAARLALDLGVAYPFASDRLLVRLVKAYGKDAYQVLGDAKSEDDLGHLFGWDLYQREVQWLMDHEYARTADDIIWRRSKLGLRLTQEEVASLEHWMQTEGLTQRALAS